MVEPATYGLWDLNCPIVTPTGVPADLQAEDVSMEIVKEAWHRLRTRKWPKIPGVSFSQGHFERDDLSGMALRWGDGEVHLAAFPAAEDDAEVV